MDSVERFFAAMTVTGLVGFTLSLGWLILLT
jgi:hypothetical protein